MADITTSILAAVPDTILLAENGDAATGANPIASLLPFLLIGLVFYFLIIRPQRKRQQEQKAMLNQLDVGDRIVTIGGFHGEIVDIADETIEVELRPGMVVTMARSAVSKSLTEPSPNEDDFDFDDDDEFDSGDVDEDYTSDDDNR